MREKEREKETVVSDPSSNIKKHGLMHLAFRSDPYS